MPIGSPEAGVTTGNKRLLRYFYLVVAALVIIGCYNVSSTTAYMNLEEGTDSYRTLLKHMVMLGLGGVLMLIASSARGFTFIGSRSMIRMMAFATVTLLLLVTVGGQEVNGARRWLNLGFISFQPSELAKITAILWAADRLAERIRNHEENFFVIGLIQKAVGLRKKETWGDLLTNYGAISVPLIFSVFVVLQPDMGTAVLILLFPAFLYIFAGAPDTFSAILVAGAGLFAIAILEPYRMERFTAFLHYEEHAENIGYQTMQSLIAVGSGGIMGQGAGNGLAKFYYLPEQHTDFAFAVWCQEWGLIGASVVVLLLLALIAFGIVIASRLRDARLALIVYGCSLLIGVQGLLNVAMVIGCFPVTGVPLPFISYGGTALLTNLIAVGLIAGAVAEDERRERKRAESEWRPDTKLSDVAGGAFRVPDRR